MTIHRVTQSMMTDRSLLSLQTGLGRLAKTQEQLATGRILNRPSDSPTDTTSAMRMRAALSDQNQYSRNAEDGLGWLNQIDGTLSTALTQLGRARDLGVQGLNAVTQSPQAREALAVEVDQLRESLIGVANTTYLGRPVFGGIVNGPQAYDSSGAFVGVAGAVPRTVAKDTKVAVNVDGPVVFGPDGANLFDALAAPATALRAGNYAGVRAKVDSLATAQSRMTAALTDVGARTNRLERAAQGAKDMTLQLTASLAQIEDVDLPRATIDLKMGEVAYQAALAATARLVQPSLAAFLR